MKANENGTDRAVRIVLGIIALVASYMWLGVMEAQVLGIIVAAIGVVMLFTGFVGFCPAYKLCGMSTCKKECCGDSCGCTSDE
jgi:hypothetical protein